MATDVDTRNGRTESQLKQMGSAEIISDRTWLGQRPKRTQAMPKNTLFGGTLEIYKDDDKEQISHIDIEQFQKDVEKQRRARQTRYHTKLPAYLRQRGENDENLEKSKETVSEKLKEHAQAKKILDVLETNSKFFNVGVHNDERLSSEQGKPHQWFKNEDLKNSDKINIMGFEGSTTKNYNRDRYERKPDTHQYSFLGDPLRPGMDFPDQMVNPNSVCVGNTEKTSYVRARDPSWLPREAYIRKAVKDPLVADLPIDLPPNIQHAFGTKICSKVLSDKSKIDETLKEQAEIRSHFYKTRKGDGPQFKLPKSAIDPVYEDLSHSVRQNMFPGYTFNHTKSLNKTDYTEDQFKNRLQDPDKWRYYRDELSTWSEHNVLRDRMTKQWEKYSSDKPKLAANWDRNAKRPDPAPKPITEKQKKVTKPKKAAGNLKGKQEDGFEPVVFKTPPVTPPPAPPPVIPKEEVKKDDQFWELYNQGK